MSTTTVAPKHHTAKPPALLTLQDIVVVDDAGDRIKGEDLARLLAFAKAWGAWGPAWETKLATRLAKAPQMNRFQMELDNLLALPRLFRTYLASIGSSGEDPDRDVLWVICDMMEMLTARLAAELLDAEGEARMCDVEIVPAGAGATGGAS